MTTAAPGYKSVSASAPSARAALNRLFHGEHWLVALSLAALTEALVVQLIVALRGPLVAPEGDLRKPVAAFVALAFFLLTAAALLPRAGFSLRQRRFWRALLCACAAYTAVFELAAHASGVDPRITIDPALRPGISDWLYRLRWTYFGVAQCLFAAYLALAFSFFG